MNILVTGGAGYIGSHTCKALARAGFTPVTFDNLSNGHHWAVRWGPLEIGDILDRARLESVYKKYRPEAVMHFAAQASVFESVQKPALYYKTNVAGTLTLLEAMIKYKLKYFVFSSSCATYGIPQSVCIAEDHPQQPINPYGRSKLIVEKILRDFDYSYGLRSISLRYFNAAGADSECEIGEAHDPETHLIPLLLDAALSKHVIKVFGNDYDTPDGTCIRDYVHVSDLAEAHVLALRSLINGDSTVAYNVGIGQGFSVLQIINRVEEVIQRKIVHSITNRRPGDPASLVADARLIKSRLGWTPKLINLDEIIETAWEWHQKRLRSMFN
jgi:UDP-arabinose 4-epimerase